MTAHIPPIAPLDTPNRRALILAGGGMRVAYQAGTVKALLDEGLRFSFADSASGGTINLAALLSGIGADELCERWRKLDVKKFVSFLPSKKYLSNVNLPAMGDADGMIKHVYPGLGVDLERIRAAKNIDATFNLCRFDDKALVALPHTQLDLERLVAAVSLPIFMPAVETERATWTDAAWIKDANLLAAVERGANELWLVWCIGNTARYKNGAFNQYVHMIEMSAAGALNLELQTIAEYNRRIALGETVFGHREPIVVHIIKPEYPLPLDPAFYTGCIDAATLIDRGYQDARRYLTHHKSEGIPLNTQATTMKIAGPGISFRETMQGGFSLAATDPVQGQSLGKNTPLAMHATIDIADISAFVADPKHKSGLTGHIDFAPFGTNIPAESGVFQLFGPSDDPRLTYMVYELGFRHQGESYYLAGKKHVQIASIFKMWSATTTLYTTLHKGTDARGPIVGAGVLSLGVVALLKLGKTLHATETNQRGDRFKAIKTFFGFFSKELLRTYVWKKPRVG